MNIDFEKLAKGFFQLPDWKDRSLKLGGLWIAAIIIYILSLALAFALAFIPVAGVLFFLMFGAIAAATMIGISAYVQGYKVDLLLAHRKGEEIVNVKVLEKYQQRIARGIRLIGAMILYLSPYYIFVFLVSIVTALSSSFELDSSSGDMLAVLFTVITGVGYLFGIMYVLFVNMLVTPVITAEYGRTLSFKSMLNIPKIFGHMRKKPSEILIAAGVIYLFTILFSFVLGFSFVTVFICVGIVLVPIVAVVGSVYTTHVQAEVLAKLSQVFDQEA